MRCSICEKETAVQDKCNDCNHAVHAELARDLAKAKAGLKMLHGKITDPGLKNFIDKLRADIDSETPDSPVGSSGTGS